MSAPAIEFFYDFSCPYAYLASTQIRALADRAGAKLEMKPFLLGGVFRALNPGPPVTIPMSPARARMNLVDMRRWASHWQVPLNTPATHPNRTVTALRAALCSDDLWRASRALFDAYWGEAADLSDGAVVSRTLSAAGFDGDALVTRSAEQAVKDELRKRTDEAIERGVFGAPTCFVDGERFWGQDRLDQVARAVGLPGWNDWEEVSAAGQTLQYWYDFSSPFAYLGFTQVEALAKRTGATLELSPFLLGALFKAIGTPDVPLSSFSQAKQRYLMLEMNRFAKSYGVPFDFPTRFPMRTVLPLRVALAAGDAQLTASAAIFKAYWGEQRDISDPAELSRICESAGLPAGLVERASDPEIKLRLRHLTELAEEHGLCGAPSYRAGGVVFWGQDREGFVARALGGWRPE